MLIIRLQRRRKTLTAPDFNTVARMKTDATRRLIENRGHSLTSRGNMKSPPIIMTKPFPVAMRSNAWVCGGSIAGSAGSNLSGDTDVLSLVSAVCCQVEFTLFDWSLLQRSSTVRGGFECDCEAYRMMRPTRESWAMKINMINTSVVVDTCGKVVE